MKRASVCLTLTAVCFCFAANSDQGVEPHAVGESTGGVKWLLALKEANPATRSGCAMAYDSGRGRVVLFGGSGSSSSGGNRGDTWEWDGTAWVEMTPATSPSARSGHAMVYDSTRGRVVLFGGGDDSSVRGDTWEWDGTAWAEKTPVTSPPARAGHAMAYDSARERVVLFGGGDGSFPGLLDDTWEWDGTYWVERRPATSPSVRLAHAMAYDSARGRVVLFGGYDASSVDRSDTWEWDGTAWVEMTPATGPSGRWGHAIAYDTARGRVVLFGGFGFGDTWEWDGSMWVNKRPDVSPSERSGHAMVYDSVRGGVVLFGGYESSGYLIHRSDTWEWDGTSWAEKTPATSPSPRAGHALVYDSARARVVLFGGYVDSGLRGDTWEWDGTSWVEKTPAMSPSPRVDHAMAYDSARGRVVLFGGYADFRSFSDTWEWDGISWTEKTPAMSPPARFRYAMAYDSARGRVVLFGGDNGSHTSWLGDTREWDGTAWLMSTPTSSPSARTGHAMAYDSARGRSVLFGGFDGSDQFSGDTWKWNGTAWIGKRPTVSAPARAYHAMADDSARGRIVLFGGSDGSVPGYRGETWEWDGTAWAEKTPATSPTARYFHAMAYDSARGRVVLFGGQDATGVRGDTWEYYDDDPSLKILSPSGGETVQSGGISTIWWLAPTDAATFSLGYSIDSGNSWKTIATAVTGRSYGWTVPTQANNRPRSKLRITSYDVSNARTGSDVSDAPFRIEVVKVESPNGAENLKSGTPATIAWAIHATLRPVASIKLSYSTNGGATWKLITTLNGTPGSYSWTVPAVRMSQAKCKISVGLLDASGKSLGKDASDGVFTILP